MKLEICVDSMESLLAAKAGGADRIELCSALEVGGLTPTYGLMKRAAIIENIEKFVMIRPRGGDLCFSPEEVLIMKEDISLAKDLGFDGVVIGLQRADGSLDREKMGDLVELARPLKVSLHRVYDVAKDPEKEVEALIDMGIIRILSSGKEENALDGAIHLAELQKRFGDRIEIMPGCGITSENLEEICKITGCRDFHMSAKKIVTSRVQYKGRVRFPGDEGGFFTDEEEVRKSVQILKKLEEEKC